jgi:hypothetical protein
MFTAFAIVLCIIMSAMFALIMLGVAQEHKRALPMCLAMFIAIIVFGTVW